VLVCLWLERSCKHFIKSSCLKHWLTKWKQSHIYFHREITHFLTHLLNSGTNCSRERDPFENSEGFEWRWARQISVVSAVHVLPEEHILHLSWISLLDRKCTPASGSDGGDLWSAVCGGDQGGFNGPGQNWSSGEIIRDYLKTQR